MGFVVVCRIGGTGDESILTITADVSGKSGGSFSSTVIALADCAPSPWGALGGELLARRLVEHVYQRRKHMRAVMVMMAGALAVSGCADGFNDNQPQQGWRGYDYNRPDPGYGGYDAGRYYRDNPRQQERRLSRNDRVYRGQDGRYYCRRNDGSTGLIIGAVGGSVLGNVIAPGGSEVLGTILGAIGGGLAGRSIERGGNRNDVRCR